jgi:hypothetical protein
MAPTNHTSSRRSTSARSTTHPPPSRIERARAGIHQMFSGRSSVGTQSSPPESPKTPRLALGLNNLSSTRLVIPYLSRSATTPSPNSPPAASQSARNTEPPTVPEPTASNLVRQQNAYHDISVLSVQTSHHSARRFADPAEQQLEELANEGRRRRHKTYQVERRCAPKVKSAKVRSKILTCFISGVVNATQIHILSLVTDPG